jgi:large exoprotein involved in heme utilization and adhesion
VNVAADRVTIEQGAAIFTETFGEGAGGNVSIQGIQGPGSPAESVILSGGGLISNFTFGSGAGGGISITAKILDLNGGSTLQSSTFGSGPNGDILVSVQRASLSNGATFDSVTSFSGETPPVGGTITVQGLQGSGSKANSLTLEGPGTALKSEAFGGGRLGKIEVHAKTVNLMDGAAIKAGTPLDTATAGTITIDADSLGLSGGSSISSHAFNLDAGPVSITADQFSLDKSTIATDTSSPTGGHGGNVDLNVGSASLSNGATINSSASNTGVAGNINILASGSVTMTSGSTITASSTGTGNAGNISIKAGNQLTMTDSSITTEATEASGGQVTISAPEMVHLINSKITTSVAGSDTDTFGGNITIDPQFVVLQNSQILAQAFAGNGGKISIISDVFLADPFSQENISATSTLGISGTVDIRSPVSNISGIIGRLPESVLAAQALLRAACAARLAESQVSSFVERGRDSIPIGPDGLLATPYLPPSSEPSLQMGSVPVDSGRESWSESFRASAVQVRRLFGPDLTPRVQLLSGDASCGS